MAVAVNCYGSVFVRNRLAVCRLLQLEYQDSLARGLSPKLAEMLVLQQAPSLQTDTRWLSGEVSGGQFASNAKIGNTYMHVARQAGVITSGKVYKHQLARFPGDPEAWVGSRGDVKRLCERRGWYCEGSVNHKPVDVEFEDPFDKPYRVADDIVDDAVADIVSREPEAKEEIESLREKVAERLSGAVDE
jgi:hypothetical protein